MFWLFNARLWEKLSVYIVYMLRDYHFFLTFCRFERHSVHIRPHERWDRLHLRIWWKIPLLLNFDLLAASLPRDGPPPSAPLHCSSSFSPHLAQLFLHSEPCRAPVHAGMKVMEKRGWWGHLEIDRVLGAPPFLIIQCLNTLALDFCLRRPEKSDSSPCVCSWKQWAMATSPDVPSFPRGRNRKENPKNHRPLNFMHHHSYVCERCIWYRVAPCWINKPQMAFRSQRTVCVANMFSFPIPLV